MRSTCLAPPIIKVDRSSIVELDAHEQYSGYPYIICRTFSECIEKRKSVVGLFECIYIFFSSRLSGSHFHPHIQSLIFIASANLNISVSNALSILVGDTNNTTRRSRTRIARLLRLLVPALAEIIGSLVNNECSLPHISAGVLVQTSPTHIKG